MQKCNISQSKDTRAVETSRKFACIVLHQNHRHTEEQFKFKHVYFVFPVEYMTLMFK